MKTDVIIVGTGVGGLFCALNLPRDRKILMITKEAVEDSDSFLAQGGICVLRNDEDYDSYFEDTMRAGHYENNKKFVEIMIKSSQEIINDLIACGVDFERDENGDFIYTREGAHSTPRILFHQDITGKEITSKLLAEVKKHPNITIKEHITMLDILEKDNECYGITVKENGKIYNIQSDYTVFATGGIGGLYENSTNYPHLTGDALAISLKHNVELLHTDYIQIHPTTLYSKKKGRRFLISESVRGEGAVLLDKSGNRFTDELLPRDVLANAITKQMEKDKKPYVHLSMAPIPKETILSHFPNIYKRCLEEGYDVTKEPIPVVPSQHYFMGGIKVNEMSKTSMERLYAVGETACNGVHGKNRLASNSLLESLVFAKRAAADIADKYTSAVSDFAAAEENKYINYEAEYREAVLKAIEEEKKRNE